MRIERPRTLFLIFGKSDGWWSKTFSHGDGANVDPATRLVCVAFGSWRLVSRNDETSHDSEVRMRDSAEKLLGRLASHFLLYCASLVAKLEFPCVANPFHDMEGLADVGHASVLVHDGGRVRHHRAGTQRQEDGGAGLFPWAPKRSPSPFARTPRS